MHHAIMDPEPRYTQGSLFGGAPTCCCGSFSMGMSYGAGGREYCSPCPRTAEKGSQSHATQTQDRAIVPQRLNYLSFSVINRTQSSVSKPTLLMHRLPTFMLILNLLTEPERRSASPGRVEQPSATCGPLLFRASIIDQLSFLCLSAIGHHCKSNFIRKEVVSSFPVILQASTFWRFTVITLFWICCNYLSPVVSME
jgi:hypothetical protein